MLGHDDKSSFFSEKGKVMLKQSKNRQKHTKKETFFTSCMRLLHACKA